MKVELVPRELFCWRSKMKIKIREFHNRNQNSSTNTRKWASRSATLSSLVTTHALFWVARYIANKGEDSSRHSSHLQLFNQLVLQNVPHGRFQCLRLIRCCFLVRLVESSANQYMLRKTRCILSISCIANCKNFSKSTSFSVNWKFIIVIHLNFNKLKYPRTCPNDLKLQWPYHGSHSRWVEKNGRIQGTSIMRS